MTLLLVGATCTFAQTSNSDDLQLIPEINQETLLQLSAQLQRSQQQDATIEKFAELLKNRDGQGFRQLVQELESTPQGRQMIEDIQARGSADPQLTGQLKQMFEGNRPPLQGERGRFPSRPPAEMRMPRQSRGGSEPVERPNSRVDEPSDDNQSRQPRIMQPRPRESDVDANPGGSPFDRSSLPPTDLSSQAVPPNSNKAKQVQAVTNFFEKNFGSLDDSPAIRGLIRDIFMSKKLDESGDGFDNLADGKTGDLFDDLSFDLGKVDFKFSGIDFGSLDFGSSGSSSGPSSSSWSAPSGGSFFGGDSWWSVAIFMSVLVAALVLWWVWPKLNGHANRNGGPRPLTGQGPWPIDPRDIHDRPTLVKAFDYIASSLYGSDATAWNHRTIAEKIRQNYAHAAINSDQLSDIYAEARYRPTDEGLAEGAIRSARSSLCKLAGVPA